MEAIVETKDLSTVAQIKAVFDPMTKMLERLEPEFQEVVAMEQSPEAAEKASVLLKQIVKARTTADKKRKEKKDYYLQMGRSIDGAYNIFKAALTPKEETLKAIKLFEERKEEARVQVLQEAREDELIKYDYIGIIVDLGLMQEDVWSNFRDGVKNKYEAVKLAEKEAEDQRIEKERREAVQDARLKRLFNIGLVFNGDDLIYKSIIIPRLKILGMTDEEFISACSLIENTKKGLDEQEKEENKLTDQYEKRKEEMEPYIQFGVMSFLAVGMPLEEYIELKVHMRNVKSDYDTDQSRIQEENEKLRLDKVKRDKEEADREALEEEDRKLEAAAQAAPEKIKLMKLAVYIDTQMYLPVKAELQGKGITHSLGRRKEGLKGEIYEIFNELKKKLELKQ